MNGGYSSSCRRGVNIPEWYVPLHSQMEVSRLSYQTALIHEFVLYVYSVAILSQASIRPAFSQQGQCFRPVSVG